MHDAAPIISIAGPHETARIAWPDRTGAVAAGRGQNLSDNCGKRSAR